MKGRVLVGLACVLLFSACEKVPTQVDLPDHEVLGLESSSFNLYAAGPDGTTAALGQVFVPPQDHRYLARVSFYVRGPMSQGAAADMAIKLRVSHWREDRLGRPVLWESDKRLVPWGFQSGWISFDAPHVELEPDKKYIAWLSAAGLENSDTVSLGVVSMGPRTRGAQPEPGKPWRPNSWSVDYPEGMRAFWRRGTPGTNLAHLSESPWIVERAGQNLHFKMTFESRPH